MGAQIHFQISNITMVDDENYDPGGVTTVEITMAKMTTMMTKLMMKMMMKMTTKKT